ncbi:MAG: hypothetical protein MHM6MM_007811 [Cercozoa sp. M6MM]
MQTGHVNEGAMTVIAAPTEVEFAGDSDVEIADVAPASHHTVVLDKQGGVWTFGRNASGELARRTPRPELSEEERALLQGRSFVKEPLQSAQATPIDWTGGRAGDDEDVTAALEARVSDVASERRVRQIGAGESRSFFVTKDGSLWAAGFAGEYALGSGSEESRRKPVRILEAERHLRNAHVVQVVSGSQHSLLLVKKGKLPKLGKPATRSQATNTRAAKRRRTRR